MKTDNISIRFVRNKAEYSMAVNIRRSVFIKEQGVTEEEEIDEWEDTCLHVLAVLNKNPVGCARIRFLDNKAKLERIAVLKAYRGKGYGRELTNYLLRYCLRKKIQDIYLHAQWRTRDFYRKLGFQPVGSKFKEANIEHIKMFYNI